MRRRGQRSVPDGQVAGRGVKPTAAGFNSSVPVSRRRLRRRAALCPMQPQAIARGVRPPAGPRAAHGYDQWSGAPCNPVGPGGPVGFPRDRHRGSAELRRGRLHGPIAWGRRAGLGWNVPRSSHRLSRVAAQ